MTDIRLENITKVYGAGRAAAVAVDDVTLTIASGEFFFLLGPSGCGKTTLLRTIAGMVQPTRGRILLGNRDVTHLPPERRHAPMVFQSYALWPHMTVYRNVEFGPKMHGVPPEQRRRVVRECLSRVQMVEYARRRPNQLSGGQQQRVALARALAAGGECLLLDEPLSNLDARLRLHMRGELLRLVKDSGATAVYVTHDQKEALSMADRIAVMNRGRVVQVGGPQEIYNRPATRFVADFVGEANFIGATVTSAGPLARVRTAAGTILSAHAPCPAAGTSVTCCIRPERITLTPADRPAQGPDRPAGGPDRPAGGPDVTILPAAVHTHTYLGEIHQYVVRLNLEGDETNGSQTELLWKVSSLAEHRPPLRAGLAVRLRIAAEDVTLLGE